jgi:hypothetical protein
MRELARGGNPSPARDRRQSTTILVPDTKLVNLRRLYDAEQRLVKALPKLRDAATSEELNLRAVHAN